MQTNLPVTVGYWIAAFLPILILLVLLVWRRWPTSAAAPVALFVAVGVALWLFRTPLDTLAVATGKGIWDAIFVLYVIWPSLLLFKVAEDAGAFEAIQAGLRRLMPDRLLVVLAFGWVLTSFIQGIAGFGTPLAVTVPLLIGLGVKPLYAVLLPIIGAAWGNAFGSLGTTWFATQSVVDLQNPEATLLYAAILLWIPNLLAGITISWLYGRWWGLRRAAPAIAVISLLHGGIQLVLLQVVPALATFIATAAAFAAIFVLNRWSFYRQEDEDEPNRLFVRGAWIGKEGEGEAEAADAEPGAEGRVQEQETEQRMPLLIAFAPYAILAVLAVVALLIPPITNVLEQVEVGLPFPETQTGYDVQQESVDAYAAFTPLTHPGTLLLISALAGYVLFRSRNLYDADETPATIGRDAAAQALPATTAITALLIISKVMDHSGEITVLALGIAAVAPDLVYLAASNFIGILGALITSSNTASNVLFAPLQATAAEAEGLPVSLAIAAQTAGGATGNALAPGDALLGMTVAGIPERLGELIGRALPWALITGILVSAGTLIIYFVTGGGG